jgi:hypothetical protein
MTFTISNHQGTHVRTLPFDMEEAKIQNVMLTFDVNPLAVILQLQEDGKANYEIVDLFKESAQAVCPTAKNIELAENIIKHYRNRITMKILTGDNISKFNKALFDFCGKKNHVVDLDELPMLVKLSEFYKEDKFHDELIKLNFSVDPLNNLPVNAEVVLKYIGRISRKTKRDDLTRYYFSTDDNKLFALQSPNLNILKPFIEKEIKNEYLHLNVSACSMELPGTKLRYYNIFDWKFA